MNTLFNRRRFLTQTALTPLAVAAGLGPALRPPVCAVEPINRTGGPRLKTSLNGYSFDRALRDNIRDNKTGVSLFELLEFCAGVNLDALDPTGYYFPGYPAVPTDRFLNEFKRRAFELGVELSGTGVRNNFSSPNKAARAADVQLVKNWVQAAARMGAPVLRVFAGPEPAAPHLWEESAKWVVDSLQPCVEHGEKFGVVIGLQNHGDMLKSADDCLKIFEKIETKWLGLVLDIGSFLTPDPYVDIARMIPYAVNWQIKERLQGNKGPQTDLKKFARLLLDSNYRGYIPIETLAIKGEDYDPKSRVTEFLRRIREALAQTA